MIPLLLLLLAILLAELLVWLLLLLELFEDLELPLVEALLVFSTAAIAAAC